VAWVWLAREGRHNAFDAQLIAELHHAFDRLATDDEIRCIVLAGRGASFCAGADVRWMRASLELSWEENVADAERLAAMLAAIDGCPKPVVARVQGVALGGGCGLVACADVAVATQHTRFGFSETRLGLIPATILPFVVAKIGLSQARALFLPGSAFDAERALRIGLVHDLAPNADELDGAVDRRVRDLLRAGPQAVEHAKRLLLRLSGHDPGLLARMTAEAIAERRASDEGQEGLRAFLDQRPPRWAPPEP
jgi:methylglutaconyl-CoA hydratase